MFSLLATGRVAASESRFTYFGAQNWTYFNDLNYVPTFEPNVTESGVTEEEVDALCGTSAACRFDYILTEDQFFAADTLGQEQSLRAAADGSASGECPQKDFPTNLKRTKRCCSTQVRNLQTAAQTTF